MKDVINFIVVNKVLLATVGLAVVSEAMSLFPGIKSNGIAQLLVNLLKQVIGPKEGS